MASTTRVRGAALGWCLLAAWLVLTAWALSALARSHRPDIAALDERTTAAAVAWVEGMPGRRRDRPMLVRLQGARCACADSSQVWTALASRARRRDIDVHDGAAAALPPALRAHELLLVDRHGHPVFLGPVDTGPMCGDRHPVDALIASLAADAPPASAVVLPALCECP